MVLSLFIGIGILLIGCSKKDLITAISFEHRDLMEIYLDLADPELDASISLTNYQANFGRSDSDIMNTMTVSCLEGRGLCNYEKLFLNDVDFRFSSGRINYQDEYDFASFFGQELSVRLDNIGERDEATTLNLYLPQILHLSLQDDTFLGQGYTITWNADVLNEEGVYIIVMYHPIENSNLVEDHPDKRTNYITVEDNGSYTFDPADFPEIPEGSLVTLKVLRGAYVIGGTELDTDEILRVFGITHATGYIKFN